MLLPGSVASRRAPYGEGVCTTDPWLIENAIYDDKSTAPTEDTFYTATTLSEDGTKLYLVGTNDFIFQYILSTAWDISTATYDTKSFDISSQTVNCRGINFTSDGLTMYIGSVGSPIGIFQYTLSTAWDISTAVYANKTLDVSAQATWVYSVVVSPDGTSAYINDPSANESIFQYTLSTPYDISTGAYANKSKDVSAEDGTMYAVAFKDDGLIMHTTGQSSDAVYEYTLSVAWDVSTATVGQTLDVLSTVADPNGIFFKSDGTKMFLSNSSTVYQYNITPEYGAWKLVDVTYDSKFLDTTTQGNDPLDIKFSPDGTKMYTVLWSTDTIYQYTVSTPWDIGTATYANKSVSLGGVESQPYGFIFNTDGTKLYFSGNSTGIIFQYTLSTAWDISTAVTDNVSFDTTPHQSFATELFISTDGTKMFVTDAESTDTIHQYILSTAWDLNTVSYDNKSIYVGGLASGPYGLYFKDDGITMFVLDLSTASVYQYTLGTAWDITTANYNNLSVVITGSGHSALAIGNNGLKMYIGSSTNNYIYQYSIPECLAVGGPNELFVPTTQETNIEFQDVTIIAPDVVDIDTASVSSTTNDVNVGQTDNVPVAATIVTINTKEPNIKADEIIQIDTMSVTSTMNDVVVDDGIFYSLFVSAQPRNFSTVATIFVNAAYEVDFGSGFTSYGAEVTASVIPTGNIIIRSLNSPTIIRFEDNNFNTIDISQSGTLTNATNMCRTLGGLTGFAISDTSNITTFEDAWWGCTGLTSFPWMNTSSCTNLNGTWAVNIGITSFPLIDTSSVLDFGNTWGSCTSLASFPAIDTSSGTNFSGTWNNTPQLTALPAIDTSSGTVFTNMFKGCVKLTCIGSVNTLLQTNTTDMFDNTPLLTAPNASEQTLLLAGYNYINPGSCP